MDLFLLLEKLLESKGLAVISKWMITMDLDFVKKLYQWDRIDYPKEISAYLCSEPMPIWIIRGNNAIIAMLEIKKFLRSQYSTDQLHTLIHCPDTAMGFNREYELLNHKMEVL
ncbi:MAG: hypothetical protein MUC28_00290 [Planctomycetes bacterium]|jgi:nucleoside diphosphate kinase|nr:hypothetical protein [Planctomycetota bacterium]